MTYWLSLIGIVCSYSTSLTKNMYGFFSRFSIKFSYFFFITYFPWRGFIFPSSHVLQLLAKIYVLSSGRLLYIHSPLVQPADAKFYLYFGSLNESKLNSTNKLFIFSLQVYFWLLFRCPEQLKAIIYPLLITILWCHDKTN